MVMKKILFISGLMVLALGWSGWKAKQSSRAFVSKAEIISCMETETVGAYLNEASTPAFGLMHDAPLQVSDQDLQGKMIKFDVSDGVQANAYYLAPKKKSKKWLIVIQEWWGLNDQIKQEADKYFSDLKDMNVLAIDMYDGKVAATPDSAMKLTREAKPERMTNIIRGAIQQAGADAAIYSVGWCFGGMWSLQTAILGGAKAKGIVMFYGRPETDMEKLKNIQCDVIGFFGNQDRSPSPEMVTAFEKNMEAAGKKLNTYKYDAGHGFANPSNPKFNAEATADAYGKAIAFLKSH
jgi:carboxymethylenebutenolidase